MSYFRFFTEKIANFLRKFAVKEPSMREALIYNSGLPVRALFSMVLGPDESFEEK